MCTIIYLPKDDARYSVAHNRDEHASRPESKEVMTALIHGVECTYPVDPVSDGTWIISAEDKTLFLFNGAYDAHERKPKYRYSRGRIPLLRLDWSDFRDFALDIDLEDIEPFTFVEVCSSDSGFLLNQLVWDGDMKSMTLGIPGDVARIWSSSTLYSRELRDRKSALFQEWLKKTSSEDTNTAALLAFMQRRRHQDQSELNPGMLLDRPPFHTVSTTVVTHDSTGESTMEYYPYPPSGQQAIRYPV